MQVIAPFDEGKKVIREMGGDPLSLCYQCGLCSGSCPWNLVKEFPIHRMIKEAQYGFFETEKWWSCTTCGQCSIRCPRGVDIIEVVKALRQIMIDANAIPATLQNIRASLALEGNPWREKRGKRKDWIGLDIKTFDAETEWLYFTCCTLAYDPAEKRIAQATANILKKIGINFGSLGASESCCAESIRKAGDEGLFNQLTKNNILCFQNNNVKKIVVNSPHCYTTFKKEYPQFGGNYEVVLVVQLLSRLISEGKLAFNKKIIKRVAYHDPCYLGRHNNIYQEPRQILAAIPGVEIVEFPENRENSICCGGGGGGLWRVSSKKESLSDLIVEQALDLGAEMLVVACPYCLINFDDSVTTMGKRNLIEVKDICNLVEEAI